MDRIDDLVPHGADLRRRVDRLHRIEPTCGHDPGVEQDLHAGGGAGHLLAGHLHLAQRSGLGRENQQMGRYDRHDHTRRTAHSAGHRLHRLGRSQPDGHVAGFLPRPDEVRQPGAGQQYLPLLRGYGDDGYSRDGREQSVEKLPESHHHRFARHGLHLRVGHLLAGLHHSGQGHQPDAIAADRFRQLLQVPAYVVGVAHHRHRADVRRAGRRADVGGRPFERYLRRGQGGLSASLLPEGQQERRTAQHPAHSGRRRNAAGAAVRGDAFGAVVLSDPLATHRAALPDHVHADVLGRDRAALQDEGSRPSVPPGQGQRPDVAARLHGFLRRAARLHPEFHSAFADLDRQQYRMVLGTRHRLYRRGGGSVPDLRRPQTVVAQSAGAVRTLPLGTGRTDAR